MHRASYGKHESSCFAGLRSVWNAMSGRRHQRVTEILEDQSAVEEEEEENRRPNLGSRFRNRR